MGQLTLGQLESPLDRQHAAPPVAGVEQVQRRLPRRPIQVFQFGFRDVGCEHSSRARRLFPVHLVRGVMDWSRCRPRLKRSSSAVRARPGHPENESMPGGFKRRACATRRSFADSRDALC
ncbi:hypothetical protein OKW45_004962 [Paraburkholderia sp. WSM4175]